MPHIQLVKRKCLAFVAAFVRVRERAIASSSSTVPLCTLLGPPLCCLVGFLTSHFGGGLVAASNLHLPPTRVFFSLNLHFRLLTFCPIFFIFRCSFFANNNVGTFQRLGGRCGHRRRFLLLSFRRWRCAASAAPQAGCLGCRTTADAHGIRKRTHATSIAGSSGKCNLGWDIT